MNTETKLLAADNDRDMLEYLEEAFSSQVHVCDNCGHETSTSECDSASDLRDYLAATPVPPQGDDWLSLAHQVQEVAAKYWKAAVKERGPGAVQWLHNSETGAMFVFTRGEYAEELKYFVMSIDEPQGDAQPVAWLARCTHPRAGKQSAVFEQAYQAENWAAHWQDACGLESSCVPLYTRPDAGEVWTEEKKLALNTALKLVAAEEENDTLRAQLAERDALFAALENSYLELQKSPGPGWVCAETVVRDIRRAVKSLSASAEPGVKP